MCQIKNLEMNQRLDRYQEEVGQHFGDEVDHVANHLTPNQSSAVDLCPGPAAVVQHLTPADCRGDEDMDVDRPQHHTRQQNTHQNLNRMKTSP